MGNRPHVVIFTHCGPKTPHFKHTVDATVQDNMK